MRGIVSLSTILSPLSHTDVQSVGSTPRRQTLLSLPLLVCPVASSLVSFASLLAPLGSVLGKVVRGI